MAEVDVHGDEVRLRFTPGERVAGLIRDQRIPRGLVRGAEVIEDPLPAVRGIRAPGLALPGVRKVGTWRSAGGSDLVCVRRGERAVRIQLQGHRYRSVLVGARDPEALVAALGG
jgi:hypothetical protein